MFFLVVSSPERRKRCEMSYAEVADDNDKSNRLSYKDEDNPWRHRTHSNPNGPEVNLVVSRHHNALVHGAQIPLSKYQLQNFGLHV